MCRNLQILASSILMAVRLDEDFDVYEHQKILSMMTHNRMRCVRHRKKEHGPIAPPMMGQKRNQTNGKKIQIKKTLKQPVSQFAKYRNNQQKQ
jgi:hypothetical protein